MKSGSDAGTGLETAVVYRGQMHDAILAIGFRPEVRIAKVRRTVSLPDSVLYVADVADLGTFLELPRRRANAAALEAPGHPPGHPRPARLRRPSWRRSSPRPGIAGVPYR
ncbi:hypothetical protein [Micromonospora sp. LOL_023]|uniref:hypothetical protein n=1 Tax=Micromonospora sp. LOL_023 TaxID=3345418 RepID=UPI003A8B3DA2